MFNIGKSTREAFGLALAEAGKQDSKIVVVDGDVHNSTRTEHFAKLFPDRFFNVGIAESNMVGVAAGLAASGKQAWVSSFAAFILCNGYDQLRMSVAFPCMNVKVVGTHAGISIGEDGPSQMGIEDVSLACSLPHFTVVVPADEATMVHAVHALTGISGPAYLRAGRPNVPQIHSEQTRFELGKAINLRDGSDLTIIANGIMVAAALDAAEQLAAQGKRARVLDMHTVKPLDHEAVLAAARETKRLVVAEEHLLHGGLGSAVAMSVAERCPVPIRFVGLQDTFAESGTAEELLAKYGLTAKEILAAAHQVLKA
ncbi:transketolase family protein [soil metagenome]